MDEYLIIDIGTSSVRVSIMNGSLGTKVLQVSKRKAKEQFDAESEWQLIKHMIKAVPEGEKTKIKGIAVSALISWVGVDVTGRAVTPCYTYAHRCEEEFREYPEKSDADVFRINGRRKSPEFGVYKLIWLKNKKNDLYRQIKTFTTLKDFINGKLSGEFYIDHTSACYSMIYDIGEKTWSNELLEAFAVDREILPWILHPYEKAGELREELAEELKLPEGTPVVCGSVDGSTGVLGAGATDAGQVVSNMGTTDVVFMVSDSIPEDKSCSLVINPHVVKDKWIIGGPMGVYGGAIDWFVNGLLNGCESAESLTEKAKQLPPGSEGVRSIPTLEGERTPFWNSNMRGCLWGLNSKHKAGHVFRAILEANCYANRTIIDTGKSCGINPQYMIAIGGGANNSLWLQIKSTVTGLPVVKKPITEATSLGACILARYAFSGIPFEERDEMAVEMICPDETQSAVYDVLYKNYMRQHELLTNLSFLALQQISEEQ